MSSDDVRAIVEPYILEILPDEWIDSSTSWHVNPTGKFVIGGPDGDAGLTGRKIIVDTYGGAAPHGGGAFSGRSTKVDRSAAYAARYNKNVVASGLAESAQSNLVTQLEFPTLSIYVDSFGTGTVSDKLIENAIAEYGFNSGDRTHLGLNKPIYQRTAAYGHFGRSPESDGGFSWERTDLVSEL